MNHLLVENYNRYYHRRKWKNSFFTLLLTTTAYFTMATLFAILGYLLFRGVPGLNLDFFIHLPKPVGELGGGMGNAILGSITLVFIASLIGIPWGILTGIYLSEYGRGKTANYVRFSIDILASVPSIVVGLFIYILFVKNMGRFSAYAGGAALAVLMIPTIARGTEELMKLVPIHIREAGLALGIPRWKVILRIVLRGCFSGVTTAFILAIARVAGETAPLLFTSLNNRFWSRSLDQPIASLPVQIYTYAIAPFEDWNQQAWTGSLVLVAFVFALNMSIRYFFRNKNIGSPIS